MLSCQKFFIFLYIRFDLLYGISKNIFMSMKVKESSVVFSTRGQVVIPRHIRKEFGIEEGTRAVVVSENGEIILRPITREYIRSFRGILKTKPGEKSMIQELLDERAADLRREEIKFEKFRPR